MGIPFLHPSPSPAAAGEAMINAFLSLFLSEGRSARRERVVCGVVAGCTSRALYVQGTGASGMNDSIGWRAGGGKREFQM